MCLFIIQKKRKEKENKIPIKSENKIKEKENKNYSCPKHLITLIYTPQFLSVQIIYLYSILDVFAKLLLTL